MAERMERWSPEERVGKLKKHYRLDDYGCWQSQKMLLFKLSRQALGHTRPSI